MTIKEIKFKWDGQGKALSAAEIDFLLSEINRLTAELKEREGEVERRGKELLAIHKVLKDNVNDPDPLPASSPYCVSVPTTYGLVAGIVRERDELKKQAAAAESLAASRLADHDSYRAAVEDALVVANIGVASGDAKADLHKLICWEIDVALDPRVSKRAADLISERETEVEKLTHERDLWENMAAMRLADQEAIERHARRVVAGEIREIAINATGSRCSDDWDDAMAAIVEEIDQKYGVE